MLQIKSFVGRRGAICTCVVCGQVYEVTDRFTAKEVHAGDQCLECKHLPKNKPTQELLKKVFNYDHVTGEITYKRDFYRRIQGQDATTMTLNGYLVVTLDKTYLAHRVIWLLQTGEFPEFVDHINHVRTDNRWENLRNLSKQKNAENKSININNTSQYLGVSQIKATGKYRAYITRHGKQIHIGVFNSPEEAFQARKTADVQYGFHENHGTS